MIHQQGSGAKTMFNTVTNFSNAAFSAVAALLISAAFISAAIGPVVPLA